MLGRKPPPIIGKLAGTFISGNRIGFSSDAATSPTSPLDYKIQSPRGLKSYDLGGVGLGIVAALEKSDNFLESNQANKAVFVQNLTRSNPIPVKQVIQEVVLDMEKIWKKLRWIVWRIIHL